MITFIEPTYKLTPDGMTTFRKYEATKKVYMTAFMRFWDDQKTKTQVTISKLSNGSLDFYKEISKCHKLGEAIGHLVDVEKIKRNIKTKIKDL